MEQLLGTSLGVFIGLTLIIAGGCAVLAGRAIAENWKPAWVVVASAFGLALADRFLVYALFRGELLSLSGFLIHFAVLAAIGLTVWRITLASKMVRQYPWRYVRTSLFSWAERGQN
jgi:hypothetical protein